MLRGRLSERSVLQAAQAYDFRAPTRHEAFIAFGSTPFHARFSTTPETWRSALARQIQIVGSALKGLWTL